jgi:cysteinyl-tRNA synthetase
MKSLFPLIIIITAFLSCSREQVDEKSAALKMQEFVINISKYAKSYNTDFIIIPQNGIELAYNNTEPEEGINTAYIEAIDGFGVEELFFNGSYQPDEYRLALLRQLNLFKKVMVSEFISDNDKVSYALNLNYAEGFICFPRIKSNYDYLMIPDSVPCENANDITTLADARNYLYLINTDNYASGSSFINAIAATNFDIIIIDLFFNNSEFSADDINRLKIKANGGKRLIISYVNIGAAEKFRYYWKKEWKLHNPEWIKKEYEGYDDEYWVEFWAETWQDIIYGNVNSYIKKIIDSGFDGAYLDNVEAYYFLYHNE